MNIKETIQFENNLYELINTCGLPVDTAFYVLKSVYLDFQKTLYECANNEGETYTTEEQVYKLDNEEKENEDEQSISTDASEYSGSVNDD
jgi:hypothetical protein